MGRRAQLGQSEWRKLVRAEGTKVRAGELLGGCVLAREGGLCAHLAGVLPCEVLGRASRPGPRAVAVQPARAWNPCPKASKTVR